MTPRAIAPQLTTRAQRWTPWIALHAAFALVVCLSLLAPGPARGWRVLALVVGYHLAVVVVARRRQDSLLWRAWTVLAPLSVLMVLPDWFLSDVLGVLHFPDNGGPFIGTVPLAMAGMWTIALMPVVGAGCAMRSERGESAGAVAAALTGLAVFVGAEWLAPALGLWELVGVATTWGVATCVVLPEVVLGVLAYWLVARSDLPRLAVVLLPFTYLGLVATSYQFLG